LGHPKKEEEEGEGRPSEGCRRRMRKKGKEGRERGGKEGRTAGELWS